MIGEGLLYNWNDWIDLLIYNFILKTEYILLTSAQGFIKILYMLRYKETSEIIKPYSLTIVK